MGDQRANPQSYVDQMKRDWDARAIEDAKWYIATIKRDQSEEEFEASGKREVESGILSDPVLIRGRDMKSLRILEIGCGIGRMTRYLAEVFGTVHATDVSREMITMASDRLRQFDNVHLYETNGIDLADLPDDYFDIAFSAYVFQHVPSLEIVRSNIRETCRTLKPGGLFKFHTNGITDPEYEALQKDTWTGVTFPESEIRRVSREIGVQLVSITGIDTKYCGTILRKSRLAKEIMQDNDATRPGIEYFGRVDSPQIKKIPTSGDNACLTLIVTGIAEEVADANKVSVEVNGQEMWPCYVGPISPGFAAALRAEMNTPLEPLTQITLNLHKYEEPGLAGIRVRHPNGLLSGPVNVELLKAQPIPPKVHFISNAVDGGVDVYAHGAKATIRIFVYHIDKAASASDVQLYIGGRATQPDSLSFMPTVGTHMLVARLPEESAPGETELEVEFDQLRSAPVKLLLC